MNESRKKKLALVLSGGGARGAYQAGVVRAIAEICAEAGNPEAFSIMSGVSAGAINAAFLAARKESLIACTERLIDLWVSININQVIRTDLRSLSNIGLKWATDIISSGALRKQRANCLLDTKPLFSLLTEQIDFEQIKKNQRSGLLETLTVSATDYDNSENVTFVHSMHSYTPWRRMRRLSQSALITVDHVCASAAIPLFFAPVSIDGHAFGDGCLRNTAPLSAAVHLDADALIVVGVQYTPENPALTQSRAIDGESTSIAQILSVLLNSVMLDGVGTDVERLNRINNTLRLIPENDRPKAGLRIVEHLHISPTEDIAKIAAQEYEKLPRSLRYLVEGLGNREDVANLSSYLLFVSSFCSRLVNLGYDDGKRKKAEILKIIQP